MNKPFFADHAHSTNGCGCGHGDAGGKHQHASHSEHDCCGGAAQATPAKEEQREGCCQDSAAPAPKNKVHQQEPANE